MKVFIDMDSTLNDFLRGYLNYYNSIFNTNIFITRDQLTQYEISKCIDSEIDYKEAEERREIIFNTKNFWLDLDPQLDAVDVTEYIYNKYDTFILTKPHLTSKSCFEEKLLWVEKWLPFFDKNRIIFSAYKNIFDNDSLLIDDKPEFLELFNGITIAFDYPFNRHIQSNYRSNNWHDIKKIMEDINESVTI